MPESQKTRCDPPGFPAEPIHERPTMERTCVKTRFGSDNSFLSSALCSSTASSPPRKEASSSSSFSKGRAGRSNRVLSLAGEATKTSLHEHVQKYQKPF